MIVGSLCSGYGGLEMGLGLPVVWHAETDPAAARVLAAHWPLVPNHGDITTVDWTGVEPVDWLTAGYPCTPFSLAGPQKGSADERHIWPAVAHAIGVLRPRNVLLENVAAHLRYGFDAVLADLAAMGYDARWGVVRADEAGAPHARARLFVVAHTDRVGGHRGRAQRRRRAEPAHRGHPAPDAGGQRVEGLGAPGRADPQQWATPHRGRRATDRCDPARWGPYAPAIDRWAATVGRPAPLPTEPGGRGGNPCLSAAFVQWLMGLPTGWVTDVEGLSRPAQLRILGNGVVPQQAALALRLLTGSRRSGGCNIPTDTLAL